MLTQLQTNVGGGGDLKGMSSATLSLACIVPIVYTPEPAPIKMMKCSGVYRMDSVHARDTKFNGNLQLTLFHLPTKFGEY